MGRDVVSDVNYWFSWTTRVNVIRGFDAEDPTEQTYFTGSGTPKWTNNVLGLAGAPYPTATRELAVPAPTTTPTAVQSVPGSGTDETRYYLQTFVNDLGWESAPSPVSLAIVVKPGAIVDIDNLGTPPAGSYGFTARRIYRTQPGVGGDTEFFFLREIGIGSTSTTDDAQALGEQLATEGWIPPPAGGHSLTALWNGMAAMLSGKTVRFCEPNALYAWPLSYELIVDDTPVAMATWQQNLVVLTNGTPYVITGQDPDGMSLQPLDVDQACVSAQSVVSFKHGVVWASPDGLVYVGAGGARILTAGLMLREDWQALVPSTIVGALYEGVYLGFYNDGAGLKGFLIDPMSPTGLYFLDAGYSSSYRDPISDTLYVLNGADIQKWNAGSPMTVRFKSRRFKLPKPVNFGAAELLADVFPVTVRVYADDTLKITKSVTDGGPFRLVPGFRSDDWQFEIEGTAPVQALRVAEQVDELIQP